MMTGKYYRRLRIEIVLTAVLLSVTACTASKGEIHDVEKKDGVVGEPFEYSQEEGPLRYDTEAAEDVKSGRTSIGRYVRGERSRGQFQKELELEECSEEEESLIDMEVVLPVVKDRQDDLAVVVLKDAGVDYLTGIEKDVAGAVEAYYESKIVRVESAYGDAVWYACTENGNRVQIDYWAEESGIVTVRDADTYDAICMFQVYAEVCTPQSDE